MCKEVGAFVHNISFPKNYSEVLARLADNGGLILEEIVGGGIVELPVTKWAVPGDIVIYMYAKSSKKRITYGLNFLKRHEQMIENSSLMINVFKEQLAIFKKYGNTIFAIGKVVSFPKFSEKSQKYQTVKRLFADIEILNFLHNPVAIEDVKEFFKPMKQSKNTPVFDETYEKLKQAICKNNDVSEYFINSFAIKKSNFEEKKNYYEPEDNSPKKFIVIKRKTKSIGE